MIIDNHASKHTGRNFGIFLVSILAGSYLVANCIRDEQDRIARLEPTVEERADQYGNRDGDLDYFERLDILRKIGIYGKSETPDYSDVWEKQRNLNSWELIKYHKNMDKIHGHDAYCPIEGKGHRSVLGPEAVLGNMRTPWKSKK